MRDAGPLQPFIDAGAGVLDGGLATELEARGADLHDALWSAKVLLEQPERIVDVHLAYFEAGADVAIGASYQASEQGFASRGIDRAGTAALLRRSVELAREARDRLARRPRGPQLVRVRSWRPRSDPTGPCWPTVRSTGVTTAWSSTSSSTFHEARLEPLVAAGPDLLAIETIPAALEVEAVFAALERLGDPVPAWCSVTVRDGRHLADGSTLDEAVTIAEGSPSVVAVGVNCSPPDAATEAVAHLASTSSLAVVAYPNRGADWDAEAKAWTGGDDVDMAAVARDLLDAGAHLVGGCCGTGPDDVRAIAIEAAARRSRG